LMNSRRFNEVEVVIRSMLCKIQYRTGTLGTVHDSSPPLSPEDRDLRD